MWGLPSPEVAGVPQEQQPRTTLVHTLPGSPHACWASPCTPGVWHPHLTRAQMRGKDQRTSLQPLLAQPFVLSHSWPLPKGPECPVNCRCWGPGVPHSHSSPVEPSPAVQEGFTPKVQLAMPERVLKAGVCVCVCGASVPTTKASFRTTEDNWPLGEALPVPGLHCGHCPESSTTLLLPSAPTAACWPRALLSAPCGRIS